jgi:hypothetical protein
MIIKIYFLERNLRVIFSNEEVPQRLDLGYRKVFFPTEIIAAVHLLICIRVF